MLIRCIRTKQNEKTIYILKIILALFLHTVNNYNTGYICYYVLTPNGIIVDFRTKKRERKEYTARIHGLLILINTGGSNDRR